MSYRTVFNEIMREYEQDRDEATRKAESRRQQIYAAIPRLQEIEDALRAAGLRVSRAILNGQPGRELADRFQQETEAMIAEKQALLLQNGLSADDLAPIYRCGLCRDTGYVDSQKCACFKQRLIDKYYKLSNLRDVLARENFDHFDLRYYPAQARESDGIAPRDKMQLILKVCLEFVAGFGERFENLLFYGEPGLGKTFLCHCVAKEILDTGKTVLYVTSPVLFKAVEDYRFNRDEQDAPYETRETVTDVDLLLIDDLGTEFATQVTSAELFHIINMRLLAQKPTIISTNLSPAELENQYSERITSRLFGHFNMLRFLGDDIRVRKKHSFQQPPKN